MKHTITPAILSFFMLALISCGGEQSTPTTETDSKTTVEGAKMRAMMPVPQSTEKFISVDSADTMLLSYLTSINYQQNDSDLRSLIINADSLRAYLADTSIRQMKIMLAHTLNYVRNGGQNQNCGYQSGELTFIIAGFNSNDNYVYYNNGNGNMVLDNGMPCPNFCPVSGTAADNLLR